MSNITLGTEGAMTWSPFLAFDAPQLIIAFASGLFIQKHGYSLPFLSCGLLLCGTVVPIMWDLSIQAYGLRMKFLLTGLLLAWLGQALYQTVKHRSRFSRLVR